MANTSQTNPAEFITPLYINGLQGRMLKLPPTAKKNREILFVYGHHSSLERWWGLVQDLSQYGTVTMPDMPGFGGMDSFYGIGQTPTVDALADYLATFIKLSYKRKRVTIIGLSFGFVVATRMLQRYPDLLKKVDLLISVVGFSHKSDFVFSKSRTTFYRYTTALLSHHIPSIVFKNVLLHPLVLRLAYAKTHNAKQKFAGMSKAESKATMSFEIYLWHCNDSRTHMYTSHEFFKLDNCKTKVNMPVWHVSVKADRYFDRHSVEQHMRVIFSDFHSALSRADSHAPSILAEADVAAQMIPAEIRRQLSKIS